MDDVLDSPVLHALRGRQRRFSLGDGRGRSHALRYRPDVGPFAALSSAADPLAWDALAGLAGGPDDRFALVGPLALGFLNPRAPWTVVDEIGADQLVAPGALEHVVGPGDAVEELTGADVDEMLALAALTRPGPFGRATIELGGYVGIRRDGRLVAMAGRRFGPPGWREVSAVCTHPDHRGQGLSRRLMAAVVAGIQREGDGAFLHVMQTNAGAAALYRGMGFVRRTEMAITVVRLVA